MQESQDMQPFAVDQLVGKIAAAIDEERPPRSANPPSLDRPRVGILVPEEQDAGVNETIAAIAEAGGAPLLLPTYPVIAGLVDMFDILNDEQAFRFLFDTVWPVLRELDVLVFPGGGDLDSRFFYRAVPHPQLQPADPWRDTWEWFAVLIAWATLKTTFGIGRGVQVMNASLRGGLFQDLEELRAARRKEMPPLLVHRRGRPNSPSPIAHPLHIVQASWLAQAVRGSSEYASLKYCLDAVPSMHHNFIGLFRPPSADVVGKLAGGLAVAGYAPDGVIEAIGSRDPRRIFVGVQFHPELARTLAWASGIFSYVVASGTRDALVGRSLYESFREDIFAWLWRCARSLHDLQAPMRKDRDRLDGHAQDQGRSTDELSEVSAVQAH